MQGKPLRRNLSRITRTSCLLCILACFCTVVTAEQRFNNLLCRPEFSSTHRETLAQKLRIITGWARLGFDDEGALRLGGNNEGVGGSASARELLIAAASGSNLLVLEDASNRSDVVFARVVEARWTRNPSEKPPAHLILIDFSDFLHVTGDQIALESFNEGWVFLHEIAHVLHDSVDAETENGVGECENLINTMRRECGLPERSDYFFSFIPGQESNPFTNRLVRMAFDLQSPTTKKKKRLWIMWDAAVIGGLDSPKQVARYATR